MLNKNIFLKEKNKITSKTLKLKFNKNFNKRRPIVESTKSSMKTKRERYMNINKKAINTNKRILMKTITMKIIKERSMM